MQFVVASASVSTPDVVCSVAPYEFENTLRVSHQIPGRHAPAPPGFVLAPCSDSGSEFSVFSGSGVVRVLPFP